MAVARPITEFQTWIASGGEARAGLPIGTLSAVSTSLIKLRSTMASTYKILDEITTAWMQLSDGAPLGDNAARALIRSVMVELKDAEGFLATAQSEAAAVASDANRARGVIDFTIVQDQQIIETQRATAEALDRQVRGLNQRLAGIRNEMDGWLGFGKGLAWVLSFGGYNPVEENRSKIRKEIEATNAQADSARLTWSKVQARQAELQACLTTLERLDDLEGRVAALAQDVSEGLRLTTDAVQEAELAQSREGGPLGPIFARLAAHRIGKVVEWARNAAHFE